MEDLESLVEFMTASYEMHTREWYIQAILLIMLELNLGELEELFDSFDN